MFVHSNNIWTSPFVSILYFIVLQEWNCRLHKSCRTISAGLTQATAWTTMSRGCALADQSVVAPAQVSAWFVVKRVFFTKFLCFFSNPNRENYHSAKNRVFHGLRQSGQFVPWQIKHVSFFVFFSNLKHAAPTPVSPHSDWILLPIVSGILSKIVKTCGLPHTRSKFCRTEV